MSERKKKEVAYVPLTKCDEIRLYAYNRKAKLTDRRVAEIKSHRDQCASCVNWMLREVLTALRTKRKKNVREQLEACRNNLLAIKERLGDAQPVRGRLVADPVVDDDFILMKTHRVAAMR